MFAHTAWSDWQIKANKTPSDFVMGLEEPGRLDVDHASGDLCVYEAV